MQYKILLPLLLVCIMQMSMAQNKQPRYTPKQFVTTLDSTEFTRITPKTDGKSRTFLQATISLWDLDDDSTTYIQTNDSVLICVEGQYKNKKREGPFVFSVIDKKDHAKRYKVYEQHFHNDRLNGVWTTYTLRGGIVDLKTYRNDSLYGLAKQFWIDRVTLMEEREYLGSDDKYIVRTYFPNKKIKTEFSFNHGQLNGVCKKYYEAGGLQEYAEFTNDVFDGKRQYYYSNGQLWIEQTYKAGKSWSVVANYTQAGKKRDAGTLQNGNGTIIFYDDDGSVREVQTFVNGVLKQSAMDNGQCTMNNEQ